MTTEDNRSQEIEREIERTRGEMQGTLNEIQRRLSPERLVDEGFRYLRQGAPARFAANFGETATREPVPTALIGIGIAWLMLSSYRGNGRYSARLSEDVSGREGPSAWSQATGKVSDAAAKVSDAAAKISGTAASARQQVSSFAQNTRERTRQYSERARQYSETAQHQFHRARDTTKEIVEEQPLFLGLLGLAIGAGLGACLPSTRREDELMGKTRDELMGAAKEAFNEVKSRVADAAQSTAEPAPRAAEAGQPTTDAARPAAGAASSQSTAQRTESPAYSHS
jgi:hypothetical protein